MDRFIMARFQVKVLVLVLVVLVTCAWKGAAGA